MSPTTRLPDPEPSDAARVQAQLEQRLFHLKTLYEFSAELSPLVDTRSLLESFLLMAMGALGVAHGVVVLYDRRQREVIQVVRGSANSLPWSADTAEKRFYQGLQASAHRRLEPMGVTSVQQPLGLFPESETGFEVRTALLFMIDTSLWGLVGLGQPIGAAPGEEGLELLHGLTASGMTYIKNARAYETIQALNVELQRSNDELRQSIAALTQARTQIRGLELARARLKHMARRELARMGHFRWSDALLIVIISSGLALLFNFSSPNGIPVWPAALFTDSPPLIELDAARLLVDQGQAVLVDARPPELFNRQHLPGAINVPATIYDIIYPMKLAPLLQPGRTAVVYGRTFSKQYDLEVAQRLLQNHDHVLLLRADMASRALKGQAASP